MSEATEGPLSGIRVIDVGTRISAPFCAGLLGELGADVIKVELPGQGDFMRTMGPFVPVDDGPGYSLSWAVEGRGRRGVTCDLRSPRGAISSSASWVPPTSCARTSAPAPWSAGASAPKTWPTTSSTCASACSGSPGPTGPDPASTAWASRSAVSSTSPETPTVHRCGPA